MRLDPSPCRPQFAADPQPSLATPTRLSGPLAVALLTTLSALALMLAPGAGLAADAPQPTASAEAPLPAATEAAYTAALASFNLALAGDDAALDSSLAQWRALLATDPARAASPVYRAYVGAATALQSRTTVFPWKKLSRADDGLALIDKALAQLTPAHDTLRVGGVPASLLVRFTAASTFNALPSMFNRGERGARLMDELLKSPLLAAAPLGFQGAVWLRAADDASRAQQADQARQWLQKLAASGAPQAVLAQSRLKAL